MRSVVLALTLAACSFDGSAATDGDDGPTDQATDNDDTPVTCGELTCGPDASCDPAGPGCVCDAGFEGDGESCDDIDECQTANGGCDALCVNTEGGRTCAAPATCSELRTLVGTTATDGEYELWIENDPAKPWTAYCDDMSGTPREFLTVGTTYSLYESNPAGAGVRTEYQRVRILLGPPRIAITDRTFATSTGSLMHDAVEVTSMPVGVAMACIARSTAAGKAELDLSATRFVINQSFERGGNSDVGEAQLQAADRQLLISGGGYCGWFGPVGLPFNPFNDAPANVTIGLSYQP